jgi:Spy/CpxP family protein refolding chaperone
MAGQALHDDGSSERAEVYASLLGAAAPIGQSERHTARREAVMNVRNFALSISVASILALASLAGCGGSVEQPQTSASAGTKAPLATQTHGSLKVFGDALGEVALREDQRAQIEKLAADAEARHAPLLAHRLDLTNTLADQIEAGTIDRTALTPKVDTLTADIQKVAADDRAALVQLHAILDGTQRNAFVDAVQGRMKGLKDHHAGFAKMKQLADDLKLTDDQRSQIRGIIHDSMKEGMKDRTTANEWHTMTDLRAGKSALESFRAENFEVEKIHSLASDGAIARFRGMSDQRVDHIVGVVEKVLPLLTPEQRKLAADKLRQAGASGETLIFHH